MKNFLYILFLCFILSFCTVQAEDYNVHSPNNSSINVGEEKTLFILDFSSSMKEYLNKERKVDSMLKTMHNILQNISPQKEVGMRVYGYRAGITAYDSCKASKLVVPITKGGNYLIKQLGLNIQEIPESVAEQQELGIYDQNQLKQQEQISQNNIISGVHQNAGIEGLNANGNVTTSYMKGV